MKSLGTKLLPLFALLSASGVVLADPIDYSGITDAVSVGGVAAAIVAMAVLKVGPNVASWASRKLAGFFR